MPILNWLGKDKVINHHQQVPYRVLEPQYTYGQADSGNMIIHGDNLDALKALLPRFEGKVKLVYIDPPYNTGNENWVYNDNVNDPKIKKWLGEVVGREGEDLSRHDKWLCMMYPRLRLLQRLLTNDGTMVISIGYQEVFNLIMLCREIFATYQVVPITVQTSGGKPSGGFNYLQEYLVFIVPKEFQPFPTSFAGGNKTAPFHGMNLATFNQVQRPNQAYPIYINCDTNQIVGCGLSLAERVRNGSYSGKLDDFEFDYDEAPEGCVAIWPVSNKGIPCVWRLISSRLISDSKKGYIKVLKQKPGKTKNSYAIQYLAAGIIEKIESGEIPVIGREESNQTVIIGDYTSEGVSIPTIWTEKDFYTVNGSNQILDLFDSKKFSYPKPVALIEEVIRSTTKSGDIVLDSFAGSGTTAHAAFNIGNRRFILIEMMDYAQDITAERVKRVIDGYGNTDGTGGGFAYYELGERLLLEDGNLNENLDTEKIREYVWYTETRADYMPQDEQYLLGVRANTAYYFYYEKHRVTILDHDFLHSVKTQAGSYLIYADINTLGAEEMDAANIRFKKIPRDITRI